jgi:hypothetical protein
MNLLAGCLVIGALAASAQPARASDSNDGAFTNREICELDGGTYTPSTSGGFTCCWPQWGCLDCTGRSCVMRCDTQQCRDMNGGWIVRMSAQDGSTTEESGDTDSALPVFEIEQTSMEEDSFELTVDDVFILEVAEPAVNDPDFVFEGVQVMEYEIMDPSDEVSDLNILEDEWHVDDMYIPIIVEFAGDLHDPLDVQDFMMWVAPIQMEDTLGFELIDSTGPEDAFVLEPAESDIITDEAALGEEFIEAQSDAQEESSESSVDDAEDAAGETGDGFDRRRSSRRNSRR